MAQKTEVCPVSVRKAYTHPSMLFGSLCNPSLLNNGQVECGRGVWNNGILQVLKQFSLQSWTPQHVSLRAPRGEHHSSHGTTTTTKATAATMEVTA